jgi:hypothetical protein
MIQVMIRQVTSPKRSRTRNPEHPVWWNWALELSTLLSEEL